MKSPYAHDMSCWFIDFTGSWFGVAIVAAPTKREAINFTTLQRASIVVTSVKKIHGLRSEFKKPS